MKSPIPKTVIVTEKADLQLSLLEPTVAEVDEILSRMRSVARGEIRGDRLLFGRPDERWLEAGRFLLIYAAGDHISLRAIYLLSSADTNPAW